MVGMVGGGMGWDGMGWTGWDGCRWGGVKLRGADHEAGKVCVVGGGGVVEMKRVGVRYGAG